MIKHNITCTSILMMFTALIIVACGENPSEEVTPRRISTKGGQSAMLIEVLTIPGCQVTPPTVDLVKATADGMGVNYEFNLLTIESHKEANDTKFIGSPTVRVNGEDIDPGAHQQKLYGVTWRRYGASAMPPNEMIKEAIEKAKEAKE